MLKKDGRLRAFHAVAMQGSFTKAAGALFLSQQAVSLQIKTLEDELGARLLQRHGKEIELTPTGKILLPYAKKIMDLYSEAEDELTRSLGFKGGCLNIGATGSIAKYCLPEAIAEFGRKYENVAISVSIENSEGVVNLIGQERIDLGIISGGSVALDRFLVEPFFEDELVFVCSPRHRFAECSSISIQELVSAPFVIREKGSGTRRLMEDHLLGHDIDLSSLKVMASVASTEAVKMAVSANVGLGMVSRLSLADMKDTSLVVLNVEAKPLTRGFYFIRPRESYLRRVLDSFIEISRSSNCINIAPDFNV